MTDTRPTAARSALWPWAVAATSFVALMAAAGFRSAPGVLIEPLHHEFGWSTTTIASAVSVNLMLYGLVSPFAAALMERLGMRRVVSCALLCVAAGSGLTVFMDAAWQLVLLWGVLVGTGTGSMALAFVATVTSRWFVRRRGLVAGVLTASSAAGNLVFLPLVAALAGSAGWRVASLVISAAALLVVPVVLLYLRDDPRDVGTVPCREHFGERGAIVFGWVFASHQVGSAIAAVGAGLVRDLTGTYDGAWWAAGALCAIAAGLSLATSRTPAPAPVPERVRAEPGAAGPPGAGTG